LPNTEHREQVLLVNWCKRHKDSRLHLIFAIPNGTTTSKQYGQKAALEGVKAGVPDLFLPVPNNGYHGLFIEMKRLDGGTLSAVQKQWLKNLKEQGYKAEVCHGCEAAKAVLVEYLNI
jgi:VRR-NUC domain